VKQLYDHRLEQRQENTLEQTGIKWITFTYFGPAIRKITNIFKNTQLCIAFRPTNTIGKHIRECNEPQNALLRSGVYEIRCNTCNLKYIGQTSRDVITRFKEHCRYIKSNNPKSAHALHFPNNQHEYGPAHNTVNLSNNVIKNMLTYWENYYIQNYSNDRVNE
jgi:hypothetical protein